MHGCIIDGRGVRQYRGLSSIYIYAVVKLCLTSGWNACGGLPNFSVLRLQREFLTIPSPGSSIVAVALPWIHWIGLSIVWLGCCSHADNAWLVSTLRKGHEWERLFGLGTATR